MIILVMLPLKMGVQEEVASEILISHLHSRISLKTFLATFLMVVEEVEVEKIQTIETSAANLRNALKGTDLEEIKKKTQDLVQSSMKLGEAIYKSQQKDVKPDASSKGDAKKNEGKKDDNVVDADFEEVKEEDKEKSA